MFKFTRKVCVTAVIGIVVGCVIVGAGVYFSHTPPLDFEGGVVSNGFECAHIGSSILKKGGSAVDSAIATLFCEGVALPQSAGIGGGFLMTIYIKETNTAETLNAREVAPLAATENMYGNNSNLSFKGGLSIAVPGELRGYKAAHQKYGILPWRDLIIPTIHLCKKGHQVTTYLQNVFEKHEDQIRKDKGLRNAFINPVTNLTYKEGELVKRLDLAATLEIIAAEGADVLYDGVLTKDFLQDIKDANGIITEEDLRIYEPRWIKPVKTNISREHTLYTMPLPGSGIILTFILNILEDFLETHNIKSPNNWQKIVESFKYAYARRSEMGDSDFVDVQELIKNMTSPEYAKMIRNKITLDRTYNNPQHYGANFSTSEDHGTAHISVLAPNGDAVAVTSTINQVFGSGILSRSTGIILNDEMDDFSAPGFTNQFGVPPSPANFIRPKKNPLSSMCPSIIVNKDGDPVLVVGAAGGTKITTSTALTIMRHLWFGEDISSAVIASRLHHQLMPMNIFYEPEFDKNIRNHLSLIGHKSEIVPATDGFAAVTAISKQRGISKGVIDPRRGGSVCVMP